jgi:glycosyltransferase involved in cell wall biosynthesis
MDGFLEDAEYARLLGATSFYVNASNAEGLCLPLMEFLSAGRPAVAPDHTAMADYIGPDIAFVLQGNLEHNVWPFDPRDCFTTMRYRLNWQSLVEALQQSFALTVDDAAGYAAMGVAARRAMQGFCGVQIVRAKLAEALGVAGPGVAVTDAGRVAA